MILASPAAAQSPDRAPQPTSLWRSGWAWAACGVGIALIGLHLLHGLITNDTLWHEATGQWILAHRAVPHRDPFSWSVRGTPWVAQEWLWEIGLTLVWHFGGLWGVMLYTWAPAWLMWPVVAATYHRAGGRSPWVLLPIAAGTDIALMQFWPARPETLTYLWFALLLYILTRVRQGERRWAWAVVPLTWVWANMHASFVLAIVFIGIELTLAFTPLRWGRLVNEPLPRATRRTLGRAFLTSLVAGSLTPQGPSLYAYAWRMSTTNVMRQFIVEWQSPNFHLPIYLIVFAMAAGLLVWTWATTDDLPLWWVIYAGGLTYGFLDSQRFLGYLCVAIPLMVAVLPMSWAPSIRFPRSHGILLGLALMALVVSQWPANSIAQSIRQGGAPVGAVNYYVRHAHGARIFNEYSLGDYLIYRHIAPYIDGRADVYTQTPVWSAYLAITGLERNPEPYFRAHHITWVLLKPHRPLDVWLATQPTWHLAYRSSQGWLWQAVRGDSQ